MHYFLHVNASLKNKSVLLGTVFIIRITSHYECVSHRRCGIDLHQALRWGSTSTFLCHLATSSSTTPKIRNLVSTLRRPALGCSKFFSMLSALNKLSAFFLIYPTIPSHKSFPWEDSSQAQRDRGWLLICS